MRFLPEIKYVKGSDLFAMESDASELGDGYCFCYQPLPRICGIFIYVIPKSDRSSQRVERLDKIA